MTASEPVKVQVDAEEFVRFAGKTSMLPGKVKSELRAAVRQVGQETVKAVQAEVKKPPLQPGKHPIKGRESHRGLRSGIAAGLKQTIAASEGGRRQGVFVVASASRLPPGMKKLLTRYNREKGWRHPSLGTAKQINRVRSNAATIAAIREQSAKEYSRRALKATRDGGTWVQQKGRPYFGKVIAARQERDLQLIAGAMDKARQSAGL